MKSWQLIISNVNGNGNNRPRVNSWHRRGAVCAFGGAAADKRHLDRSRQKLHLRYFALEKIGLKADDPMHSIMPEMCGDA